MKKILLIITSILPFLSNAQLIFDKYDNIDDVRSVEVNDKMFEMIGKLKIDASKESNEELVKYLDLVKRLDKLKIYKTTSFKILKMISLDINEYVKSNHLEELMHNNDASKKVSIYVKSNSEGTVINNLLMFIENSSNEDSILLLLTGKITLQELSILTKKLDLPYQYKLEK